MAEETNRFSLSRWSRRKLDAKRAPVPAGMPDGDAVPPAAPLPDAAPLVPVDGAAVAPAADEAAPPPLPPVESLSVDSDFRPYFAPKVDEETKRAALRKLFTDPHFNVMDGLDVYIDDYNKPDPMPPGMLERIVGVYDRLVEESAAKEAADAADRAAVAAADAAPAEVPALAEGADVVDAPGDAAIAADDAVPADPAPGLAAAAIPPPVSLPRA